VIQGCDKWAIEKSVLLVTTVCAVSVVVVVDCSHDERHADEAIAHSPARLRRGACNIAVKIYSLRIQQLSIGARGPPQVRKCYELLF
jgi:hypothetical protein